MNSGNDDEKEVEGIFVIKKTFLYYFASNLGFCHNVIYNFIIRDGVFGYWLCMRHIAESSKKVEGRREQPTGVDQNTPNRMLCNTAYCFFFFL